MPRKKGKRPKQAGFLDNLYESVMIALEDVMNDVIDAVEQNAGRIVEQQGHQPKAKAKSGTRPKPHIPPYGNLPTAGTHYDDLEVTRNASPETIEAAYKSMAKRFHPDVSKHPQAEAIMKRMNAAWETLKDTKKRAEYDRALRGAGL